jgi:hypothetical protein
MKRHFRCVFQVPTGVAAVVTAANALAGISIATAMTKVRRPIDIFFFIYSLLIETTKNCGLRRSPFSLLCILHRSTPLPQNSIHAGFLARALHPDPVFPEIPVTARAGGGRTPTYSGGTAQVSHLLPSQRRIPRGEHELTSFTIVPVFTEKVNHFNVLDYISVDRYNIDESR